MKPTRFCIEGDTKIHCFSWGKYLNINDTNFVKPLTRPPIQLKGKGLRRVRNTQKLINLASTKYLFLTKTAT
jgi:hypothetical protein